MKKKFFLAAVLTLLAISCSQEDDAIYDEAFNQSTIVSTPINGTKAPVVINVKFRIRIWEVEGKITIDPIKLTIKIDINITNTVTGEKYTYKNELPAGTKEISTLSGELRDEKGNLVPYSECEDLLDIVNECLNLIK